MVYLLNAKLKLKKKRFYQYKKQLLTLYMNIEYMCIILYPKKAPLKNNVCVFLK